jgi:glyoxylase I family protein
MPSICPLSYHGLDHVVLKVTDITRSLDFYTRILGMPLERIIEDAKIYQVRCGRHLIDLQEMPPGVALAEPATRGVDHVCLLLRGAFSPVVEYLRAQGVTITFGPVELYGATGFGTSVYVKDPDGHTLELKADHAEYPLRTSATAAMASLTRPPAPRT